MKAKTVLLMIAALCAVVKITGYAQEVVVGAAPPDKNVYQSVINGMTEDDYEALRQVVYWESARADCPHEVNVAVVETVLNRMISDDTYFKKGSVYACCHQKGQFVCKALPSKANREVIDDAIAQVVAEGLTVLPDTRFQYFATKMQRLGTDHSWIGEWKADGSPRKGKGMYFCRGKE